MKIKNKKGVTIEEFANQLVSIKQQTNEDIVGLFNVLPDFTVLVEIDNSTTPMEIADDIRSEIEDYFGVTEEDHEVVADFLNEELASDTSGQNPFQKVLMEAALGKIPFGGAVHFFQEAELEAEMEQQKLDEEPEEEYTPEPVLLGAGISVNGLSPKDDLIVQQAFQQIVMKAARGQISHNDCLFLMQEEVKKYPGATMIVNTQYV